MSYRFDMNVVYLVRHGEVANPNHVVYADLPGFDLSPIGVIQAQAVADHLRGEYLDVVISSPLQRAIHTAVAIARTNERTPRTDPRLTETRMYPNWTGRRWDEVEVEFPAQLAGYLDNAANLSDVEESLEEIALRCMQVISDAIRNGEHRIAIVSHQDPISVTRLAMLELDASELRVDPPQHASVSELHSADGRTWREVNRWTPDQGA